MAMKKLTPLLLTGLLALTGCASQYVMKLNNGTEVRTAGKPKLDKGYYICKDAKGREFTVPQGRVRVLEPASMAREEEKQSEFKPQKPHHWWHFW